MMNPRLASEAYKAVLEVITFKQSGLPRFMYTTHVKLWVGGRVVKIFEVNGDGRENCKRIQVEDLVSNANRLKAYVDQRFHRTRFGWMKSFKEYPNELLQQLDELCEAVYKSNAVALHMTEHMIKTRTLIGHHVSDVGNRSAWKKLHLGEQD